VVARVGGLADSLVDANQAGLAAGVATGVQFMPVDRTGLEAAIARAIALHARPAVWTGIQTRGMKTDVSWTASAGRYAELYRDVLKRKRA
jgi:starch synthase